ncbi:MAG: hypothetical protein M1822_007657 [Bathelium mastoideum]|nr:MAG: hypothetical protein M1822_007657 [Bathelium mastoideum]
MNDGGVFEADAGVDAKIASRAPGKQHAQSSGTGEGSLVAAKGGVGTSFGSGSARNNEDAPLLEAPLDGREREGRDPPWEEEEQFKGRPWYRKPSIYWMLLPFLVHALAFGGIIVPRMNLYLELICREVLVDKSIADPKFVFNPVVQGTDGDICRQNDLVQSKVSLFTLYGNLISGILSAIISPKLGALSDRYGRKKLIIITSMGMLGTEIISIVAAGNLDSFNSNWLFLGFALDGISGSFIAAMSLAHAYATDCTPPSQRSVAFGLYHGCLFSGIAVGPILAGFIIKRTGTVLSVFWIAVIAHLFFIVFVTLFVPESLSQRRQRAAQAKYRQELAAISPPARPWARSCCSPRLLRLLRIGNLFEPLRILWPTGPGTSAAVRANLALLAAIDTIMFGVAMGSMTVVIYYTEYQFGWGNFESARFISIVNSCRVVALLVLLPGLTRLFRGRHRNGDTSKLANTGSDNFELSIIRVAVLFDTIGYLGYALVRRPELMILSGSIAAIGGIGSPSLQAALTKHVPADKTGQLLGASGLLHALARVVAPAVFNAIYSKTVGKFTQTVFVCLAALFGVAFLLSWFVRPHGKL